MLFKIPTPDFSWLPKGWRLIMGGALGLGLVACVLGVVVAGCAWAFGVTSERPDIAAKARSTLLACLVGAFVIGGGGAWLGFLGDLFADIGKWVS